VREGKKNLAEVKPAGSLNVDNLNRTPHHRAVRAAFVDIVSNRFGYLENNGGALTASEPWSCQLPCTDNETMYDARLFIPQYEPYCLASLHADSRIRFSVTIDVERHVRRHHYYLTGPGWHLGQKRPKASQRQTSQPK
jgi:hypothetical protein